VTYKIAFTWNKVILRFDSEAHHEEGGWNEEWGFQVIDNKLKLIQHMVAG
jgi:hypothetical protein